MYRISFPVVEGPGRETDHSAPSKVRAKDEWIHTSSPPICLHDLDREEFILSSVVIDINLRKLRA
jgi:hypothetical protein